MNREMSADKGGSRPQALNVLCRAIDAKLKSSR
jgi:hypothetical protein